MEKDRAIDEDRLREAGVRPTRQRLSLGGLISDGGRRHLTADTLHREAMDRGLRLSLATVYNTLHEFAGVGLLRRLDLGERTYFCTNPELHHHFFDETTGQVADIPGPQPTVAGLPEAPAGSIISGVEVVVRIRPK